MVDFNSVRNSRDCRADKSQIARSREIGLLQNVKQALFLKIFIRAKFNDKNQREKHYCYYIIQIYLKRFDAHSKRHPQLKNLQIKIFVTYLYKRNNAKAN